MKYKLVLKDGTTGQAMYNALQAEGFTVPVIPRPARMTYIPHPTAPQDTPEGQLAWKAYEVALKQAKEIYDAGLLKREIDADMFAQILGMKFAIAGYQVYGKTETGRKVWCWLVVTHPTPERYYRAWADLLTGQYTPRPTDPIYKLSNG